MANALGTGGCRRPRRPGAALAVTVGTDGFGLLEAVYATEAPEWLRHIPAVQALRAVWVQQYYRDEQGLRWRGKSELPPGALAIGSPYDLQARYGVKRGVGWRGYKAHFTETCQPDRPHLIVHVATTVAATNDVDTVAARHADLASADLLPMSTSSMPAVSAWTTSWAPAPTMGSSWSVRCRRILLAGPRRARL